MSKFQVVLDEGNGCATVTTTVGYSLFNGGEVNLRLHEKLLFQAKSRVKSVYVMAQLQDSDSVMALCMLVDALKREHPRAGYSLGLGYTPYARQDRVCNPGEALSIRVFANIINSLGFNTVVLVDPHSDVAGSVINNVVSAYSQAQIIGGDLSLSAMLASTEVVLVSPDAGATKKTEQVSKAFGGVPVVQGYKQRDLATGALSGFGVSDPDNLLAGSKCLIVDDICDGGGTFLGLSKVLRDNGAAEVELYVTHGIFSQGIEKLLDNGLDHVYTTDTFNSGESHSRLTCIPVLLY
jgi:ribose-phosphate pyrophosphokinase